MLARVVSVPGGAEALHSGVVMMRPSGVSPGMDGDGDIQGGVEAEDRAPKGMFQMSRPRILSAMVNKTFRAHYRLSLNGM